MNMEYVEEIEWEVVVGDRDGSEGKGRWKGRRGRGEVGGGRGGGGGEAVIGGRKDKMLSELTREKQMEK